MAENNTPLASDYAGVREYIGARYVPVFANPPEWTNTRGYEPLTIALHNGDSYTSAQFVPTGIDISDTSYWMKTGDFNAQVEQYRKEVQAFDGRITQNANDITTVKGEISTLNSDIDAIDESITSIESATELLKTHEVAAKKYSGGVYLAFGDSITKGRYVNPNQAWPAVAAEMLGMEVHNYGVNSAAFTRTGELGMMTQIETAKGDTSFNATDVRLITIAAGVNDALTEHANASSINNALRAILAACAQAWPNADIVVLDMLCGMLPLRGLAGSDSMTGVQVYQGIEQACRTDTACRCISSAYTWSLGQDTWHTSTGQSPYGDEVNADALHPNVIGNERLAWIFVRSLMGDDYYPSWGPMTITGKGVTQENLIPKAYVIDGIASIMGQWIVDPAALDSNVDNIIIELPLWAAFNSGNVTMVNAIFYPGYPTQGRAGTPVYAVLSAQQKPSQQNMGKYVIAIRAPENGWVGGRLVVDKITYRMGC